MGHVWRHETIAHAWSLWGIQVVAGLLAVPFGVLAGRWLAARRRRAGASGSWAARSAFAEVALVVGTFPWVWMTLSKNPREIRGVNLVPLADLHRQFHIGTLYAVMQISGNLLVFAALGFALPIRWRVGPLVVLAVGIAGSAIIETLQYVLDLGRYSSVDDILVNAAGAFLFAWASRPWWRRRPHPAEQAVPQPALVEVG
ncbi:MAG TPA: VanZ family protein [Micromonosporaceae bacterium]|nr:VanZ family protein [Micromonosporaceae bacterium]